MAMADGAAPSGPSPVVAGPAHRRSVATQGLGIGLRGHLTGIPVKA